MKSFKERVLSAARKIKAGELKTYKEIAKLAGNAKAARAAGNILARNKNPQIPCHRVIRSNGLIGGYKGSRSRSKEKLFLLLKEGATSGRAGSVVYNEKFE